jgi:hypothetical protein
MAEEQPVKPGRTLDSFFADVPKAKPKVEESAQPVEEGLPIGEDGIQQSVREAAGYGEGVPPGKKTTGNPARNAAEMAEATREAQERGNQLRVLNARAAKIRTKAPFVKDVGGHTAAQDPSEWGEALRMVNQGKAEIQPITANQSHDHSMKTLSTLKSFLDNLRPTLEAKAAAHEKAASEIEEMDNTHPEVNNHRAEAARIRGFLSTATSDKKGNLRFNARTLKAAGAPMEKRSEFFELQNKAVELDAKLRGMKDGSGNFKTDSPSKNHPALQVIHNQVASLNENINRLLSPLDVGTPISRARMELVGKSTDMLQTANKQGNPLSYRDAHPDLNEDHPEYWSEPGTIWGDKKGQSAISRMTDKPLRGGRETIKISDENLQMLKGRKDKRLFGRMKSAMDVINKGAPVGRANLATASGISSVEDVIQPYREAAERKAQRDVLFPQTGGGMTRGKIDPQTKKVVPVGVPARSPKRSEVEIPRQATEHVGEELGGMYEREGHIKNAIEQLISSGGTKIEPETFTGMTANLNEDDATAVTDRVMKHFDAHNGAVNAFRAGKKPSKSHSEILGAKGLARARTEALNGR